MKKGEIVTGIVESTTFPSNGIIKIDEQKVGVKGVIEGQTVALRITKTRKEKAQGALLSVEERSPLETAQPPCPHFGVCGGCFSQTLPYEQQLQTKERHVRQLLKPVLAQAGNDIEAVMEPILGSPHAYEYRNKMEFSFGDEYKDGPLALGLHKKGSFYDLVTTSGCCLIDEDMRKILQCTLEFARTTNRPYYHKMRQEGFYRHLLVRKARKTGQILVDLVTTSQAEEDFTPWVEALTALSLEGTLVGILHTTNDAIGDIVRDDGTACLYGQTSFEEELLGLRFQISPFSFFQTNSLGAEVLYSLVRDWVKETGNGVLFDLYSGTGTIGQLLAPVAKQVIGIELIAEAVEAAKENAHKNNLDNCTFLAGDVLKMLDEISERPDYIILDPPREGIHPKALSKIIQYGVDQMIYISCKPTSLANDLVTLQEQGYRVERVRCVDMFPQTVHVETVCLLSKKP